MAQSLFALAPGDIYRRENDADWIPGILGIRMDRTRQPVAFSKVDSNHGSLRPSSREKPIALRRILIVKLSSRANFEATFGSRALHHHINLAPLARSQQLMS